MRRLATAASALAAALCWALPAPAASALAVRWAADVDQREPASPAGFSLPAVVGSGERMRVVIGGEDARIRILDAGGRELHRIPAAAPIESGALALPDGTVVLADLDGHLYGIDSEQGVVRWRAEVGGGVTGRPVALGDGFLIQTVDNRLYRFTGKGRRVWSYTASPGGLAMRMTPSPLVVGRTVYAVFTNGDVIALDGADGKLRWKRQLLLDTDAEVLSELQVPMTAPVWLPAEATGRGEDMVAVAVFQGDIHFLAAADGSRLAQRRIAARCRPLRDGATLYVGGVDGALWALEAGSGETLWRRKLADTGVCGPVKTAGGELVLTVEDGRVLRVSPDGKRLAERKLPGRIDRIAMPAADGVLVRTGRGILYRLR
ncbi:MAG: PQQ-binding-like beta-propeller repeat protein [Mariprofundaceae bacterium]